MQEVSSEKSASERLSDPNSELDVNLSQSQQSDKENKPDSRQDVENRLGLRQDEVKKERESKSVLAPSERDSKTDSRQAQSDEEQGAGSRFTQTKTTERNWVEMKTASLEAPSLRASCLPLSEGALTLPVVTPAFLTVTYLPADQVGCVYVHARLCVFVLCVCICVCVVLCVQACVLCCVCKRVCCVVYASMCVGGRGAGAIFVV